jgi:hypothetical protein
VNLGQLKPRDVSQGDQIGRRSGIIADTRNTRAPAYDPSGTMRTASRGDGGADGLLRSLGIAQKGAADLADYSADQYAADEKDNIEEGAADQQLGTVDPVMLEKSDGYRNAVTKGRTMADFNSSSRAFDAELRGVIEKQDVPDLAGRMADVRQRVEAFYHGLAVDPETKQLRPDVQSPTAMRYLADAITRQRPQLEAQALGRIEARFNGETVTHFQRSIDDQSWLHGSAGIDLGLALSVLSKTVPTEMISAAAVDAFVSTAGKLTDGPNGVEGLRLLDGILGKPKALDAGVLQAPSDFPDMLDPVTAYERGEDVPALLGVEGLHLNADEMIRLRQTRDNLAQRLRTRWRAKVSEDQGHNASGMALRIWGQGNPLTPTEITEGIRTGAIDPQQGVGLYSMSNSMQNQQQAQADRVVSLADRAEDRTRRAQISAISGRYMGAILSGRMTGPAARSALLQELPAIRDPQVQAAVANTVLGTSADIEKLVGSSKEAGFALRRFSDKEDLFTRRIADGGWRGEQLQARGRAVASLMDQVRADFAARLHEGMSPAQAEAAVVVRFKPQIDAVTAPKPTRR